jgi:FkbM family methyltransferase
MDLFTDSYFKKKYYFFNGQEKSFESMDTDAFFQMCIYNNIKLLSFSPSENRILLQTEDGIILVTNNRFWTIDSVFARNEYSVPQIYMFKDFVVFDIGMNRGYAALKFASFDSCKKVYGFEIDPDTYNLALENFNLNPELYDKIKPFDFGLYDDECALDIFYIPGYDGITTTKVEFTKTQPEWVKQKEQMQIKKVHVKEAGRILSDIIKEENIQSNIILKIDTEGAESKILDNLTKHEFIDKVDLIIGETHLESEDLELQLPGFKSVNKFYSDEKIYNFCLVKDKWYNELNRAKSSNK